MTGEAYALGLRQFTAWSQLHHLRRFRARRADIGCFARGLESRGRARATITRRLCTIAGFYRDAAEEAACHADPRTTIRCDRARGSLGRHATYIVVGCVAGASR